MRVSFYGLEFEPPSGWEDVTEDMEDSWPPTLARPDGCGAIQFSIARQAGGVRSEITLDALQDLVRGQAENQGVELTPRSIAEARLLAVGGHALSDEHCLGMWLVSNGADIAFVTYLGPPNESAETMQELAGAEQIVRSMTFGGVA